MDGTELLGSAGDASGGGGLIGDGGFVGGGDLVKLVLLGCCNAVVYNWVHNKVRTRLGPDVAWPPRLATFPRPLVSFLRPTH